MVARKHPRSFQNLQNSQTLSSVNDSQCTVGGLAWENRAYVHNIHLSHYSTFPTFFVSYASPISCIEFPIVCCTHRKVFIDTLSMFRHKIIKFLSPKSGQILCTHSPILLCWVTCAVETTTIQLSIKSRFQ